jgi:hypothetical protein
MPVTMIDSLLAAVEVGAEIDIITGNGGLQIDIEVAITAHDTGIGGMSFRTTAPLTDSTIEAEGAIARVPWMLARVCFHHPPVTTRIRSVAGLSGGPGHGVSTAAMAGWGREHGDIPDPDHGFEDWLRVSMVSDMDCKRCHQYLVFLFKCLSLCTNSSIFI